MTASKRAPVRAVKANDDEYVRDPFEFTVGRTKITLPSLSWLKPGQIAAIQDKDGFARLWTLLSMSLTEKQLAVVGDMEPDAFADMMKAWNDHSGVSLGES
jgi:hypothetical protein